MKILNLYAGIGGNRKLWGDEHEITAIEYKPEIAKIYQEFFPKDIVIVADAHQYLLDHFKEFDFIWSSPPCPSHSRARFAGSGSSKEFYSKRQPPMYPDMRLHQEIILLKHYFKGKWVVENVISFYDPLIKPVVMGGHYFWLNFYVQATNYSDDRAHDGDIETLQKRKGLILPKNCSIDRRLALRNCVEPELGKALLDFVINPIEIQKSIFA